MSTTVGIPIGCIQVLCLAFSIRHTLLGCHFWDFIDFFNYFSSNGALEKTK